MKRKRYQRGKSGCRRYGEKEGTIGEEIQRIIGMQYAGA